MRSSASSSVQPRRKIFGGGFLEAPFSFFNVLESYNFSTLNKKRKEERKKKNAAYIKRAIPGREIREGPRLRRESVGTAVLGFLQRQLKTERDRYPAWIVLRENVKHGRVIASLSTADGLVSPTDPGSKRQKRQQPWQSAWRGKSFQRLLVNENKRRRKGASGFKKLLRERGLSTNVKY